MIYSKSLIWKSISIAIFLSLLATPAVVAGVVSTIWGIGKDIYSLIQKAREDEEKRREEQRRNEELEPEGVLHIYFAWVSTFKGLKRYSGKRTSAVFLKIAILIQNRCDRPILINGRRFAGDTYLKNDVHWDDSGELLWEADDELPIVWSDAVSPCKEYPDLREDCLREDWLKPGHDTSGYIYIWMIKELFRNFSYWDLYYNSLESGDEVDDRGNCVIYYHSN